MFIAQHLYKSIWRLVSCKSEIKHCSISVPEFLRIGISTFEMIYAVQQISIECEKIVI